MTDRLPPSAPHFEQAVIGCCLTSPKDCLPQAQAILVKNSFYSLANQIIWDCLCEMLLDSVDVIAVQQKLKDNGTLDQIGGLTYLAKCQDQVTSTANIEYWIKGIQDKWTVRRLIACCTNLITDAYNCDDEAVRLLDCAERDILAIRPQQNQSGAINELVEQALEKIDQRISSPRGISGLSTGLADLDRLTDGLHRGEMIVVAGYPSTGKTAISVGMAVFNAIRGTPCAIFSAEMRPVQLVVRSICAESRVNFYRVNEENVPTMRVAASKLASAPLYIEQANRLSMGQVLAIARRLKQKHDINLAVVDYIQILTGTGDNREQEIADIAKGCKAMAMELDIPVLALSQLTDDGKLRESRAIGQIADGVWKLELDGDWVSDVQPIKLTVEKCRDGATGFVNITFLKTFTKFENAAKINDDYERQH
jgi:replicative DNA helicase